MPPFRIENYGISSGISGWTVNKVHPANGYLQVMTMSGFM